MNRHELLDVAIIELGALLVRDAKLFGRSLDAPPLVEVAAEAEVVASDDSPDPRSVTVSKAGQRTVAVETPVGEFEAAYLPWQWLGPDHPTLIYHHGSGEHPFEFSRFGSNTFRRLFVEIEEPIPANVVAVRAPFHDRSNVEYVRAMGDLSNFVGMVAASVGLVDALAARAAERADGPVVVAGVSLGGYVANCHRAVLDGVDRYAPIFAGAALGEMFVSSIYRKLVADTARQQPERLRSLLDFTAAFQAVDADDCDSLLARYDRIVEFETQKPGYAGRTVSVIDKGHVTGALATETLRSHVRSTLDHAE